MQAVTTLGAANMALIGNGYRGHTIGRVIGATLVNGAICDSITQGWVQSGRMDNLSIGEGYGESGQVLSYPDDMNVPYAYHPAQFAGRMAAYSTIIGSGALSPDLRLTLQAIAALDGSGDVSAFGGLIVQMIAALEGSGTISDADMQAFLLMVAAISGEGGASANISALAELAAQLLGDGEVTTSLTGTGAMSSNILAYGELTPEGIRDSVWNALASQYNAAGSMGEKLNDAGSASNPWTEVIETGLTAGEIMKILLAVAAGDAEGLNAASVLFKSQDGTKNRIEATQVDGNRTIDVIDVS